MGANISINPQENQCSSTPPIKGSPKKESSTSRIQTCTTLEEWNTYFNKYKGNNTLVVVDFTATWCGPCRSMEPILKKLADEFVTVEFVTIDVDEVPQVASEYGVQAMPTFLLMKNGNQVDKVVGARKEDLQRKIEKHHK